jgi:hypothetical protein
VEIGADLLASVIRHDFTVTRLSPSPPNAQVSSVFTQPPVAALLFVGVGVSIP